MTKSSNLPSDAPTCPASDSSASARGFLVFAVETYTTTRREVSFVERPRS